MKSMARFTLVFLLLPLWHCATSRPFVTATDRQPVAGGSKNIAVVRAETVVLDLDQINARTSTIDFTALGQRFRIVRNRVEQLQKERGTVWYGRLADQPNSFVTIVRVGDAVAANIDTAAGESYQIRYAGDGLHSFRQIDRRLFPDEKPPLTPTVQAGPATSGDTCATDPASDIDVLILYTDDARTEAGSVNAMEAEAFLAVAETNQSYINSGVAQRLRVAHIAEVSYAETGDFDIDLPRLQNGSDGHMDSAPTLRNTHAADVVSLIMETGDGCGLGYRMDTVGNAFEQFAYSVAMRSCATGNFSFGHEIGHNMGADHDAPNAAATQSYPYNRGWTETTPTAPATPWRTIMAYQTTPASTRVQYWSSPLVNFPTGGDVMGDAAAADNHRVLNNTALTVANFRCSSPGVSNVWMRDTWADTGVEPNPSSDPMWISPYIWIRNAQDTGLVNQHIHQNPINGATNWAYVKLHNGGATAASGTLELYVANASVSLTWPGSWGAPIASIPVSGFAAHSTRVVEATWTPSGTGHWCMIARWNSTGDPMATAEGSDINANVRNNNNLVWRNLNVVSIGPDPSASGDATMIVANPDRESRGATALVIRPGFDRVKTRSFFGVGEVTVELDPVLLAAWRDGGARGTGFRRDGDRIVITSAEGATLDNLMIPPGQSGQLRATFRRSPTTPKGEYRVDFEQLRRYGRQEYRTNAQQANVVGGVSYEVIVF